MLLIVLSTALSSLTAPNLNTTTTPHGRLIRMFDSILILSQSPICISSGKIVQPGLGKSTCVLPTKSGKQFAQYGLVWNEGTIRSHCICKSCNVVASFVYAPCCHLSCPGVLLLLESIFHLLQKITVCDHAHTNVRKGL